MIGMRQRDAMERGVKMRWAQGEALCDCKCQPGFFFPLLIRIMALTRHTNHMTAAEDASSVVSLLSFPDADMGTDEEKGRTDEELALMEERQDERSRCALILRDASTSSVDSP